MRAVNSIIIVGWDFHSRTQLHHDIAGAPQLLGDFLNYLVQRRRRLEIRVLIWDYPVIFSKGASFRRSTDSAGGRAGA